MGVMCFLFSLLGMVNSSRGRKYSTNDVILRTFESCGRAALSPELVMNQVAGGLLWIDGIRLQNNLKSRYLKLYAIVTPQIQLGILTNTFIYLI